MSGKMFRKGMLAILLNGLCLSLYANTTTDTSAAPAAVYPVPVVGPTNRFAIRVALLLPLRSEALGRAAQALFAGFMAAYEKDPYSISLTLVETGDVPQQVVQDYASAAGMHDILIGPLSRSCVSAVALSGQVTKPTIALTQPEATDGAETLLPPKMLSIGLSVEEEARQTAGWAKQAAALVQPPVYSAFVIATTSNWQRRAAKAFAQQWQQFGLPLQTIELRQNDGILNASALAQLKARIAAEKPAFMFAALDAEQVQQIRAAIGMETLIYGTSQLNPFALLEWGGANVLPQMNDVRLVDIPWQLPVYTTQTAIFSRTDASPGEKHTADMQRLYALGIDAFKVAKEIALKKTTFELNGMTGKLSVNFEAEANRFQRTEQPAVYQDGTVVPFTGP